MVNEQPNLDSWEDFSGKFIKIEFITKWPALFIPISVRTEIDEENESFRLIYTGEIQGRKKDWQPNKTNQQIMQQNGISSPKNLIGKKVWFKQVMNFNPQLKKKVPALEIEKIE